MDNNENKNTVVEETGTDEVTPRDIDKERFRILFAVCIATWISVWIVLIMLGCYIHTVTAEKIQPEPIPIETTCTTTRLLTTSKTTTNTTNTTTTATSTTSTTVISTTVISTTTAPVTYVEPVNNDVSYEEPTYDDYVLLCNLVAREYGSDWVPVEEKAKVVATVMNRVNSDIFPNTIYEVVTQPNQFSGYVAYYDFTSNVTSSVKEAVDYYFAHPDEFGSYLYFYGDGTYNHFY